MSKISGSIRQSISRETFIHLTFDYSRDGTICAFGTCLCSGGHSAFADQRMALFGSRFQYTENPLLCPSGAKGAHFAGILEDCWLEFVNLRRHKTVWWTKSKANHSPPPKRADNPNLGSQLIQCPISGNADNGRDEIRFFGKVLIFLVGFAKRWTLIRLPPLLSRISHRMSAIAKRITVRA